MYSRLGRFNLQSFVNHIGCALAPHARRKNPSKTCDICLPSPVRSLPDREAQGVQIVLYCLGFRV